MSARYARFRMEDYFSRYFKVYNNLSFTDKMYLIQLEQIHPNVCTELARGEFSKCFRRCVKFRKFSKR